MQLTQNQLKSLRYDLQSLANIGYDEVMDELLDHYATLTEQNVRTSVSVVICLLLLLYKTSFVQLFREKFIYKPKLA